MATLTPAPSSSSSSSSSFSRQLSEIVTPPNRTATVWKHFGFQKDDKGKLIKSDCALCKACGTSIAHGGGTIILRNHLRAQHPALYYELFPTHSTVSTEQQGSSKQDTVHKYFPQTDKISLHSPCYKMLTEAIASFITSDMRPVNVVDGTGFLKLMQVAEPRYVVPCRKTNESYRSTIPIIEEQCPCRACPTEVFVSCYRYVDSKRGDGYISLSLTCHFLTSDIQIFHRNLTTQHLPGIHDHTNTAEAIKLCVEWCIEIIFQVSAFTNDNGSNIVKALNEDIPKIHIPCAGHNLNLSVHAALTIHSVQKAVARCRKIVAQFNHSRLDREELVKKQKQLEIPQHSLIKDVETMWNSTYDD